MPTTQKRLIELYNQKWWQSFLFMLSMICSISVDRLNELVMWAEMKQSEEWLLQCHLD